MELKELLPNFGKLLSEFNNVREMSDLYDSVLFSSEGSNVQEFLSDWAFSQSPESLLDLRLNLKRPLFV